MISEAMDDNATLVDETTQWYKILFYHLDLLSCY